VALTFVPAIIGALTVLIMYFLGKDTAGKAAGLLAALFLALEPTYIERTGLGFFDTEVPGIIALVFFALVFLRAIDEKRSLRSSMMYTVFSGLALTYFILGWGAAYYIEGLVALFVFVLILLKRYTPRLLITYSMTFGIALFGATKFPDVSLNYLTSAAIIPVAAIFLLLCLAEFQRNNISLRTKLTLTGVVSAIIVVGFVGLWQLGFMENIAGKFATVIDPFIRASNPLIDSVAEHRVSSWGSMYVELGIGIFFFLSGLYFTLRNPTNRNIFLLLFGVTGLYFAASMVRLLAIYAPAFALLVGAGVVGILKPFFTLLREAPQVVTRAKRGIMRVSKEYSGIAIFLVFILLTTNLAFSPQSNGVPRVYGQAYNPLSVTSSSVPLATNVPAWTDMLNYCKTNLQGTDVVVAWWDYGYWLGILGNVTSIADNATINATQIENDGFIMMGNETNSLRMLQQYNASYILVFITIGLSQDQSSGAVSAQLSRYGDEAKWSWMARISGQGMTRLVNQGYVDQSDSWIDENAFGSFDNDTQSASYGQWVWNAKGTNSTIYKLMSYALERWTEVGGTSNAQYQVSNSMTTVQPTYFTEQYFAGEDTDPLAYGGLIPVVALYKINWAAYNNAINPTG
jgi:dolichyl-diphosphooligosaccharide--protein glycosyltransferase